MKLLSLSIRNVASLAEANIDFANGPLADEPLFLITGITGSGKTTILNCICLALYNTTPALNSIEGRSETRNYNGLSAKDPAQMLRRGTTKGSVTLIFEGNDGNRYEAYWEAWKVNTRDGSLDFKTRRSLSRITGNPEVLNNSKVDKRIEEVVGLTFMQFTRTTLLAQGQFNKFLLAKGADKAEILEKITNTEIYSEISKEIYRLYSERNAEYDRINNEIKGFEAGMLKPEEIEEKTKRLGELDKELAQLAKLQEQAEGRLAWLQQHLALSQQLEEKQKLLAAAKERQESEATASLRAQIHLWDITAEHRTLEAKLAQFPARQKDIDTRTANLASKWWRLLGNVKWLENHKNDCEAECKRLEGIVKAEAENAPAYANSAEISNLAASIAKRQREIASMKEEKAQLLENAEKSAKSEIALKEAFDTATADAEECQKTYASCLKDIQAFDLTEIREAESAARKASENAAKAIEAFKTWQDCSLSSSDADKKLADCKKENEQIATDLAAAKEQLPKAEDEKKRAQALYDGFMRLNQHIEEIREKFENQHTCPLCGNQHATLRRQEDIDQDLASAKDCFEKAQEVLVSAQKRISELEGKQKASNDELQSLQKKADAEAKKLASAVKQAEALGVDLSKEDCLEQLKANKTAADEARAKAEENVLKANKAQNAMNKASVINDKVQKALNHAEKNLAYQKEKTRNYTTAADTKQELIDNQLDDIESELSRMHSLAAAFTFDADHAVEQAKALSTKAAKHNKAIEDARKAKEEAQRVCTALDSATALMQPGLEKFGNEAGEVAENKNIDVQIQAFFAEANKLEGENKALASDKAETSAKLDSLYAENAEITHEKVMSVVGISSAEVQRQRAEIAKIDDALTSALAASETVSQQLAAMQQEKPEMEDDATLESLQADVDAVKADNQTHKEEQTNIRIALDEYNKKSAMIADKAKEREEAGKERDKWKNLNEMFGGKEGTTFRNIAQSYLLRILLQKANYYLGSYRLMPRYQLDCEPGCLDIHIIDAESNGLCRDVSSLSGGESFVVSLALALGLSSIKQNTLKVDTLFIDEGFGSLSPDCLETVIDTLDKLHMIAKRRVGIISHVELLKERISRQIVLEKHGSNVSTLTII